MDITFYKYQGAGNDFILIDDRENSSKNISIQQIEKLCDRRFGIGADGLMFLRNTANYDFEMVYHNADGKVGSMCGNGGRCIVAFAKFLGIFDSETNFLAVDGHHYAKIANQKDWIELQMIDVNKITEDGDAFVLNTGSPHFVKEVVQLADIDMYAEGYAIRNNTTYKNEGINVNFVEVNADHLFVRTFERGVEDETFACGTGVTAAAMSIAKRQNKQGQITTPVKVLGGNLEIRFDLEGAAFSNVFLCGPAQQVFKGQISL